MRDPRLDIIRTIGVIMVISFHIGEIYWGEDLFFPNSIPELLHTWQSLNYNLLYLFALIGDMAVPIFLFLSGYLFANRQTQFTWHWFRHRLRVLLPPYWLAVIVCSILVYFLWQTAPQVLEPTLAGPFSWQRVLAAVALVQNFSAYTFNSPVPAWWFIPILIQGYLALGYWSLRLRQHTWSTMTRQVIRQSLVLNAIVLLAFLLFGEQYWAYFSILRYWSVVGLGLAWGMRDRYPSQSTKRLTTWLSSDTYLYANRKWIPFSFALILLGWFLRLSLSRWLFPSESLIALGWFILLYGLLRTACCQAPVPRAMANIGHQYSYLIYLWHQPLIWLIAAGILYL